jgi:hypothetical protein
VTGVGNGDGDAADPVDVDHVDAGPVGGDVAEQRGKANPVAAALRELAPAEHAPRFWDDLDRRLADEPQLRLAPRAAIRPITQPPPVIDDRKLAEHLSRPRPRTGRWTPTRFAAWGVAVLVTAVLIAAALYNPDDKTQAGEPGAATSATTASGQATTTTAPTTSVPPGSVDPAAPLAPDGVGELRINTSLRDLQAAGFSVTVDQATFQGSGGTCYDARAAGALDLLLRFRSPEAGVGVADPADGMLAVISIESGFPTARRSDKGIGLGAPQDQVLGTYPGNLEEHSHPFIPGGRIFVAPANQDVAVGIAYLTDGVTVNRITVGARDAVRYVNQCR